MLSNLPDVPVLEPLLSVVLPLQLGPVPPVVEPLVPDLPHVPVLEPLLSVVLPLQLGPVLPVVLEPLVPK